MALALALRSAVTVALAGVSVVAALILLVLVLAAGDSRLTAPEPASAAALVAKLPLAFEENAGRADDSVRFLARGPGYTVFLTDREAVTRVSGDTHAVIRTRLVGASASEPRGVARQPGAVNSFVGRRERWRSNIPTFGRVVFPSVYAGIDVVYHGKGRSLEYDFNVAPGADPRKIALTFAGADGVAIAPSGDLELKVPGGGTLTQEKPVAYQVVDGTRKRVAAEWQLRDGRASFGLGAYDRSRPLVIDPVLTWATYYGSGSEEEVSDITVDSAGNMYAVGATESLNFPTSSGAFQRTGVAPYDGFILKLDPNGARVYASYLGGYEADGMSAVDVDATGAAFVAGSTATAGMQVPNEGPLTDGDAAGYVAKFSPDGSQLVFYRYIQGSGAGTESVADLELRGDKIWIAGTTSSAGGIATVGDTSFGGSQDAFVARLGSSGLKEIAAYVGGARHEYVGGLAFDADGDVFVAGSDVATDTFAGADGYVTKRSATLASTAWSVAHGGSGEDWINGIVVDSTDRPIVMGYTNSPSLPGTVGGLHRGDSGAANPQEDVFLTRFAALTGGLGDHHDTVFIGGTEDVPNGTADFGTDIAIDSQNNVYVVGQTSSSTWDFDDNFKVPLTNGLQGSSDGFVFKGSWDFPGAGGAFNLVYWTHFGSSGFDRASAVATDDAGSTWIGGAASAGNLPTTPGTAQPGWAGDTDTFFARIGIAAPPSISGPSGATKSRDADFTWSASDSEPNMRFKCKWDSEAFADCSSPATKTNLSDGQHTFTMQAYDAGSTPTGGEQSRTWIVDNVPPGSFDLADPADGAGGQSQRPVLAWNAAPDASSGVGTYQLVIDGAVDSEVPASVCADGVCRTQTSKTLSEGTHTWKVVALDGVGLTSESPSRTFSVSAAPNPSLTVSPNPALVGRTISFEATSGLDESLVTPKYEWDLDGDGAFELDTAATPRTTKVYGAPGTFKVGVKVSTPGGASSIATVDLKVNDLANSGQLGVSIEAGARYVNTPDVTVTVNAPVGVTSFLFSNDGGFFQPESFRPARLIKWKLDSSGPERLPKTIYVRFLTGPIVSQTYQDDIILDETPPKVQAATVAGAASASVVRAAAKRRYRLKVRASDSNSGVAKLQATANKRKPGKLYTYKRKLTLRLAARPRFVRARDRAGNYSKWRKLRR